MTMAPVPAPLLLAEDLAVGYFLGRKNARVVAGPLQLALYPGELVCLLGPNGAGKSTLLRTLAGLQPPLAGRLVVAGVPLAALGAAERARQLSIVLTDRFEAAALTVQELVSLGRHPHTGWLGGLSGHDHALVRAALEATGTTGVFWAKARASITFCRSPSLSSPTGRAAKPMVPVASSAARTRAWSCPLSPPNQPVWG